VVAEDFLAIDYLYEMFRSVLFFLFFSSLTNLCAQIAPCLSSQSFTIVVLGSSTAAGSGPSHPDSAWVNRYRTYLKTINNKNEVVNLAVGGTTTYDIMPSNFVPALAGRPLSDTLHNITYGLKQNPDAIIVNMPSNDASRGFSPSEQLFNFDSLIATASAANVPVWICTTQPRNKLTAVKTQWQIDVKDSVIARYGSNAIDFWSGMATSTGTMDSLFNSGDGIHLNDTGHYTLFHRVKNKSILLSLFQASIPTDYQVFSMNPNNLTPCGDSALLWEVLVTNIGADDTSLFPMHFKVTTTQTGSQLFTDTITRGLKTCEVDTFFFSSNSYYQDTYLFSSWISAPLSDTSQHNDTLYRSETLLGHPPLLTFNDTACMDSAVLLTASTGPLDSLLWYSSDTSTLVLQYGPTLFPPTLHSSLRYFVRAVRGPLTHLDSLTTTKTTDVNWNGAMFDVVAHRNLTIDSLAVKVSTLGVQLVEVYQKSGSYVGHEANASSWSLLTVDTVTVTNVQQAVNVNVAGLALSSGDTAGFYIQLQNGASTLSYLRITNAVKRTNNSIEIITGSGISHNFSGTYFPRDWSGTLFYHYGFNPLGQCHSPLTSVYAHMEIPRPNLGNDTSISFTAQLQLNSQPYPFANWSTGDTATSITLTGSALGLGVHTIAVEVISKFGCTGRDSIEITVVPTHVPSHSFTPSQFSFYPNPSDGTFLLKLNHITANSELTLFDLMGKPLYRKTFNIPLSEYSEVIHLPQLVPGTYLLVLKSAHGLSREKITIN
jgi:lysophospholipase L1-like esterase